MSLRLHMCEFVLVVFCSHASACSPCLACLLVLPWAHLVFVWFHVHVLCLSTFPCVLLLACNFGTHPDSVDLHCGCVEPVLL